MKDHVVGGASPLSRERGQQATSERVRRVRSTVSVDRRERCQRAVLVVSHARHADGMVHATTRIGRLPARIGAAARAGGCRMVDLGIRTHETRNTTSNKRSREENSETSDGRVVQSNEHGVSVPRLLLPWSPVHPTRCECRQRETHGPTARRDPKEHRLPTSLCKVVDLWEFEWKEIKRDTAVKSVWMLHFLGEDTRGGR